MPYWLRIDEHGPDPKATNIAHSIASTIRDGRGQIIHKFGHTNIASTMLYMHVNDAANNRMQNAR